MDIHQVERIAELWDLPVAAVYTWRYDLPTTPPRIGYICLECGALVDSAQEHCPPPDPPTHSTWMAKFVVVTHYWLRNEITRTKGT